MTEIFNAKTIEEAKELAAQKFKVSKEKIKFEIIEEGKKGILGFGSKDARVKATYNVPVSVMNTDAPKKTAPETPKAAPVKETAEAPEKAPEILPKAEIKAEKPVENNENETEIIPVAEEVKPAEEKKEKEIVDDEEEYSLDNFTLIENESDYNAKTKIAIDYINSILSAMEIKAEIKVYQNETGAVINIDSDSNGTIIGRRGDTLDAIQYLSSMIANKGDKEYFRITIDCFGYREKRKVTLQQLAEKVAKSVLRTGRSQPLEPMNPYERRVIHSAISKIDGVSSRSVGDEPYRKIIISSENGGRRSNDRRRGGNGGNRNRSGGRRNSEHREARAIDLSTSFEKDYKRPKPEDNIEGGLYGKIEF